MTRARPDAPGPLDPGVSNGDGGTLAVCIEEYADSVQCTFFPYDADEQALLTTWMTAADDAFVDLDEWR